MQMTPRLKSVILGGKRGRDGEWVVRHQEANREVSDQRQENMSGYLPFLVIFIHEPIFMTIYEHCCK